MKKRNIWTRFGSAVMALVLLAGCLAMGTVEASAISSRPGESKDDAWKSNVLVEDPLEVFKIKKELINSVTFQDTTAGAPKVCWYLGADYNSRRVLGWITWTNARADIVIAAEGGINGKDACEQLFLDCNELTEVNFNGAFHTEEAESMEEMFRGCVDLEEVDVSTLDTSNVESMYAMFSICDSLVSLDLSNFDTSNVTNMGCMFSGCSELEEVFVQSFDTSKVYNMEAMFGWCDSLYFLDLTKWDFSSVLYHNQFMDYGVTYNGQPWENLFR